MKNRNNWINSKIAKLFGVDNKAYKKQIQLPLDSNNNERPSLHDEGEQLFLIEKVRKLDEENSHPTLYNVEQMVIKILKKYVTIDTLRNYLFFKLDC